MNDHEIQIDAINAKCADIFGFHSVEKTISILVGFFFFVFVEIFDTQKRKLKTRKFEL